MAGDNDMRLAKKKQRLHSNNRLRLRPIWHGRSITKYTRKKISSIFGITIGFYELSEFQKAENYVSGADIERISAISTHHHHLWTTIR